MNSLLLIDVDGPLSPFRASWFAGRDPAGDYAFHDLTPDDGLTYRVALDASHGSRLRRLAAEGFELAWASTWQADANRLIAPILGLPRDLPVVPLERPRTHRGKVCWKAPQIAEWVGDRPFVWFDDEINRATRDWLGGVGLAEHLAHRVEPHIGLVEGDFAAMADFIAASS